MSNDTAIQISGVGKLYKLTTSPLGAFLMSLGITRSLPWKRIPFTEFWALRDIDLELPVGKRIGIVGRNGAGKSTLLKLISGSIHPTEGHITVNGHVQALMDAAAGFHPEFTGYENIRAALIYQGLTAAEIEAAIEDIEEFTELGQFMGHAFKTYSAGMTARLTFATATSIKPEILIIDEVLGAGDGYFLAKSNERMQKLVKESGATVLIVSHALDQIIRLCEEAIWLDRGRIVQRGPSMEVIRAYSQFLRVLEERKLRAKNVGRKLGKDTNIAEIGSYSDSLKLRFVLNGEKGVQCDISTIVLREYGTPYEELRIGDAQDTSAEHNAFLELSEQSSWSAPHNVGKQHYRSLVYNGKPATGEVVFSLYAFYESLDYTFDVSYQCQNKARLTLEVWKNQQLYRQYNLPTGQADWVTQSIELKQVVLAAPQSTHQLLDHDTIYHIDNTPEAATEKRVTRKWPGENSLIIDGVTLLGNSKEEQVIFEPNMPMILQMTFRASRDDTFTVIPVAAIFRTDGIEVTKHIGEAETIEITGDVQQTFVLDFGTLQLGNGRYVISVALYSKLDVYDANNCEFYDLIDRSYEFEIVGNPPLHSNLFQHPGEWSFV